MKKWLIGLVAVAVLGAGWFWYSGSRNKAVAPTVQNAVDLPAPAGQTEAPKLIIGQESAPLTMIEYTDPQCPLCKNYFESAHPQVLSNYVETGKLKIEVRVETHIGAGSVLTGQAWYCANDQSKFEEFYNEIFGHQREITFNQAAMKDIAIEIGLDRAAFDACLDGGKYKTTVEASHEESKSRISGTPTFFIGTQRINGAQPFSTFKTIIDAQL